MAKLIAFGWYGGKFSHLNWLLPLLPPAHHYCEPFGGSAAVLLNREPSALETYNDVAGDVVHFFRVLREQTEALTQAVVLTPFSREEFVAALDDEPPGGLTDLERARRFYVRARQVRSGMAHAASPGRWAYTRNPSRAGMALTVSRWFGSVHHLPEIALRLLRVQIENDEAVSVIKRYDTPDTLFYCDPPYPHAVRGDTRIYANEMTDEAHVELAELLHNVQGRVALSGYRCDLLDGLYGDWQRTEEQARIIRLSMTPRIEVLWTNYLVP